MLARELISDVVTEPLSRAGKAARSLATIIEYQMQFLIGIASCASGGVFLAVLSTDAAKFYIKNVDKLDKWYKALRVAIEVRSTLRRVAPTLYDKLIDRVLIQVYQSVMELPKEMLNDPKIAGRGLGVLLAKLGKKTLAARLSALSIVWSVLWAFLKSAVGKIPAAVKTKTINDIYAALKSGDIGLSRDEVKKILEEIQSHPEEIKSALGKLIDAFQGV